MSVREVVDVARTRARRAGDKREGRRGDEETESKKAGDRIGGERDGRVWI